jgi:putative oxidoreductase
MKIAGIISQVLVGLIFVVFGANAFLHFIPMPPPQGQAGAFMGAMFGSGYYYAVAVLQIVGGLLLLSGRFASLGLIVVGPIIVNILLFHIFLEHAGLPLAIVVAVLSLISLCYHREAFLGLTKA